MPQNDNYKQAFHLQPFAGSLADPNGVCQVDGFYHIYYIVDPESFTKIEKTPYIWAQYTTRDFIHYKREPYAIFADNRYDRDGVYSGCVVVANNQIHAIYTGNVRHPGNFDYIHEGREQNILKTSSNDGITFTDKHVLMRNSDFPDDMTNHVRDPFITYVDGHYQMVLGARRNDDVGLALVYQSDDLEHFTFIKRITTREPFGYMWECPELLTIDDDT
ncbi:MAG: glycoside hydrolase family 32 protein, partial [bacterium]